MSKTIWICKALEENNFDRKAVARLYNKYIEENGSDASFISFKKFVWQIADKLRSDELVSDYDEEDIVRLEAAKQKAQDVSNVLRKSNREGYRIYNNLEELFKEYIELLGKVDLTKYKIKDHPVSTTKKIGIMQFSDLHANELIYPEESNNNSYDFTIMSQRLKKYVTEAISIFKFKKISEVHVFMSGDFINSSRRLGEKLSQATSLAKASLLTTFLLQQVLTELAKHFNVTVSAVIGNESRFAENWDATELSLSENFDFLIFNNLRMIFNKSAIKFNDSKDFSKCIVPISKNFTALLLHGNQFKTPNGEKEIARFLQKYTYNGIKITGVFYGHYHSASLGDFISRSSSLCGGNAYSSNDLGYISRASQNLYIVNEDGGYDAMKIDLQNVDSIKGYDINEDLERYQVKSVGSTNRVVIENLV